MAMSVKLLPSLSNCKGKGHIGERPRKESRSHKAVECTLRRLIGRPPYVRLKRVEDFKWLCGAPDVEQSSLYLLP